MLTITVQIPDLSQLATGVRTRVDKAVAEAAEAAANDAKASMAMSKSGTIYKRGGISHVASAPGEPPAIDTGQLIGSVRVTRLEAMRWAVGAGDTEYAAHLEYGTRKMAARPFLRPAAERARPVFMAKVLEALRQR